MHSKSSLALLKTQYKCVIKNSICVGQLYNGRQKMDGQFLIRDTETVSRVSHW